MPARLPGEETTPWEGWPGTRYEAKAASASRKPRYLIFQKRR
jgi:tRNA (guanine-N7-)-methyltransferase